jgi:hypothetical protein
MNVAGADWEKRVSELWTEIDRYYEDEFVGLADALVAELPPESAIGLFELGGALDSPVTQIGRFRCTGPRWTQAWWVSVAGELPSRWPALSGILGNHKTH